MNSLSRNGFKNFKMLGLMAERTILGPVEEMKSAVAGIRNPNLGFVRSHFQKKKKIIAEKAWIFISCCAIIFLRHF
jgi:hypothetical protein